MLTFIIILGPGVNHIITNVTTTLISYRIQGLRPVSDFTPHERALIEYIQLLHQALTIYRNLSFKSHELAGSAVRILGAKVGEVNEVIARALATIGSTDLNATLVSSKMHEYLLMAMPQPKTSRPQ